MKNTTCLGVALAISMAVVACGSDSGPNIPDQDQGGDVVGDDGAPGSGSNGQPDNGATPGGDPPGDDDANPPPGGDNPGDDEGGDPGDDEGDDPGPQCDDPQPGYNSEDHAVELGTIDDCDGDGANVEGKLPSGDADWYRYVGNDSWGCAVDASRSLVADDDVRLCKYLDPETDPSSDGLECEDLTFDCPEGTTPDTSPEGRDGCCSNDGAFELEPNCKGTDDSVAVYIRVDSPNKTSCISYALDYHY